jgi:hypothetical protein
MDTVRLATPEEISNISTTSDLSYATSVFTYGGKDFAVIRNCFELDPMIFAPESNVKRMAIFAMNMETLLRFQGVKEIYFNVAADNHQFQEVLKTWGAEPTSPSVEIRYKKVL